MINFFCFDDAIKAAHHFMKERSGIVHTEKWQGTDIKHRPEAAMHEVMYFNFNLYLNGDNLDWYRKDIKPNLPWADDHFLERVSGEPLNPGKEWANWPFAHSANNFRDEEGRFNHTYMERFWPRFARYNKFEIEEETSPFPPPVGRQGIQYRYGDLNDLVEQFLHEPLTRQGYLPIFFPEDTGLANPDRKPCTLGYLFFMRKNRMDITYYIRSCDLVRHFQDDLYLTVRLLLWVLEKLKSRDVRWLDVKPGMFRMDIGSLHCFRNDYIKLYGA